MSAFGTIFGGGATGPLGSIFGKLGKKNDATPGRRTGSGTFPAAPTAAPAPNSPTWLSGVINSITQDPENQWKKLVKFTPPVVAKNTMGDTTSKLSSSLSADLADIASSYAGRRKEIEQRYRLSETDAEKNLLRRQLGVLDAEGVSAAKGITASYQLASKQTASLASGQAKQAGVDLRAQQAAYQQAGRDLAASNAGAGALVGAAPGELGLVGGSANTAGGLLATQGAADASLSQQLASNNAAALTQLAAGLTGEMGAATSQAGRAVLGLKADASADHAAQVLARIAADRQAQQAALDGLFTGQRNEAAAVRSQTRDLGLQAATNRQALENQRVSDLNAFQAQKDASLTDYLKSRATQGSVAYQGGSTPISYTSKEGKKVDTTMDNNVIQNYVVNAAIASRSQGDFDQALRALQDNAPLYAAIKEYYHTDNPASIYAQALAQRSN